MVIDLKAKLETRKFKNGDCEVLVINLTDNTEKLVFLSSAELELLKLNKKANKYDFNEMPDLR